MNAPTVSFTVPHNSSLHWRLSLTQAEGQTMNYVASGFTEAEEDDVDAFEDAKKREKPVGHLGPAYATLVVPAIPASDIRASPGTSLVHWPKELQRPLIKVKKGSSKVCLQGVASGVRSALVKVQGRWYRLKGCGNNDEGFIFQVLNKNSPLVNIRGCSFEHTSQRELYMTESVEKLLSKHGLQGANQSLGYYKYQLDAKHNPLPKVARTCVVTSTLGNRRLQDHVIVGIENLLHRLVSSREAKKITTAFPVHRVEEKTQAVGSTWMAIFGGEGQCTDLFGLKLAESLTDLSMPEGTSPLWGKLWKKHARRLSKFFKKQKLQTLSSSSSSSSSSSASRPQPVSPGSLLCYIFWRFGWETGMCLRTLREGNISWGTYADLMGVHCNAHTNNLVLRAEANATAPFLAMLDLDMAFTKKSHMFGYKELKQRQQQQGQQPNSSTAGGSDGKREVGANATPQDKTKDSDGSGEAAADSKTKVDRDDAKFDEWMGLELNQLKMALAGYPDISTGIKFADVQLSTEHTNLKWALRDTMTCAFEAAVAGRPDAHPLIPQLTPICYSLLRLALITTVQNIA